MTRLTITLSDRAAEKLSEEARLRGKSVDQVIEEALLASSRRADRDQARARMLEIMDKAAAHAASLPQQLGDDEAVALGEEIAHEVREDMMRRAAG